MKTLGISIPVYKRPHLLKRCLEALCPQCGAHDVDIYIFDDSCSDINQKVYDEFIPIYHNIHLHFNSKNLGIDENIDQCFTMPNTSYIWVIGEDDLVANCAIEFLLDRLLNSSPTYLFVNYQYISNDYKNLLHVACPEIPNGHLEAGRFFADYGWATGFLGANIINKNFWDSSCRDFMGTYFNHVGKIFSKLCPDDLIDVSSRPLVFNRAESLSSFSWLNEAFEVNAGFGQMLDLLSKPYPKWKLDAISARICFKERIDLGKFRTLLVLRALGIYNYQKYTEFMRDRKLSWIYVLIAVAPISPLFWLYEKFDTFRRN